MSTSVLALLFWAGGLSAWASAHEGIKTWKFLEQWLRETPPAVQGVVLIGGLVVIGASAMLVDRLTFVTLRVLEGYWPQWLHFLRGRLVKRQVRRANSRNERFEALDQRFSKLSSEQLIEHAQLDARLRRVPVPIEPEYVMPTRLGNILRAAERLPLNKYGLDPVKCWPTFWLVLPESVKKELASARANLDESAKGWLWGMLFTIWTVWAWWAAPLGIAACVVAYYGSMLQRAEVFGDLLEASFDLHRKALYEALRWPLPSSPSEEKQRGDDLTVYLWQGSDAPTPVFVTSSSNPSSKVETPDKAEVPPTR